MATMKPLHQISSEQLNTSIEVKTPALTESDGQPFAQTLRQQMQQEMNTQAYRQTEDKKTQNNLETQSRLSQQQIERSRLAMQNNQVKSSQVNKSSQAIKSEQTTQSEQATKVAQANAPAQNNALQNRATQNSAMQANTNAKQTNGNKAQNDQADLTVEASGNESVVVALTEALQTATEASATTQNAESLTDKNANPAGVDENAIANMGWLASMMAMRENQAIPANKPIAEEAESMIATNTLIADKTPKMSEAEGLLDKTAANVSEESMSLNDFPSMRVSHAVNDAAKDNTQGLALGKVIGSEQGLASFAKDTIENAIENVGLDTQAVVADNQPAGISKALEQLTKKLEGSPTDSVQSLINAQTTTAVNTTNALTQSPQVMVAQVNVPFGIQGWQEAMNKQVMQMTQQGSELATLTLSPPDLGPVQVVLRVENQSVDAAFVSDNINVRQALEDGLQDLKESMASQGLQLGNTFVGNGNQAQQHFNAQAQHSQERFTQLKETVKESVATPVRAVPVGLVDTFV